MLCCLGRETNAAGGVKVVVKAQLEKQEMVGEAAGQVTAQLLALDVSQEPREEHLSLTETLWHTFAQGAQFDS